MTLRSAPGGGQDRAIHEVAHFVDNNGPERPTYAHQTVPHELRNAWRTTKTLEEQLEIANQPILRRVVMHVRESLFAELMAIEGYSEVPVAPEA